MNESIGHYAVLGTAGTGGPGTVFRARDTRVGRTVAVRLLGGVMPDPLRRTRAIDLIQPYTAVSHPHIATLFEVGEHDGSVYLVHEFVHGDTLAVLTAGRPLNVRRAVDVATQVADALADVHSLDLVLGGLNPATVVVTTKGHAKILDVGLTAWTREEGRGLTAKGLAAGLPADPEAVGCMAPEQLVGGPGDARVDLFALGALLHQMLTGDAPFSARNAADCAVRVLQFNPAAPSALNPDVPSGLDVIVTRALAKRPEDRYQSAAAMAADLRALASTLHVRDSQSETSRARAAAPPSPWPRAVFGVLFVATLALAAWHWYEPAQQAWRGRFGEQPAPVLIVLPFEAGGADATRPHFGAGFAEDLARRMGHVPGLSTPGRMSLRALAGKGPQVAAQEVRASVAVTGLVTPEDEDWKSLRFEVRLVEGASGRSIWTRSYTSAAQDIISLQARITRDIAGWLRVAHTPTAEQGRVSLRLVDPGAYDLYLQARGAMAAYDASRATQLFESAVAADPTLVEAQTGLVEALYLSAIFDGRLGLADIQPRIREAAEAASTTDPDFAPTRLAMALAAPSIRGALQRLREAVAIDPSYTQAYLAMAALIREADPPRAIRIARRVLQADPLQPFSHFAIAESQLLVGEFNEVLISAASGEALMAGMRGTRLVPALPWWEALRTRVHMARPSTRDVAGPEALRGVLSFPPYAILRAAVLQADGHGADAVALLTNLVRLYPGACDARAMTVAIRFAGGARAEAARLAGDMLVAAEQSNNQTAWARCAAMAAAGVNDAPRAATWIARAASSDDGVRWWSAGNGVLSVQAGLRQRVFPWAGIAGTPEVGLALTRLDTALGSVRADAAKLLEGY